MANVKRQRNRGRDQKYRKDRKVQNKDPKMQRDDATNSPDWYITDPSMLTAVASYPFGLAMGVPQRFHGDTPLAWDYIATDTTAALPGILAMNYTPVIGDTETAASAANTAAQAVYTAIRSKNSGAKNYEPADVMTYLLSMDSIYMYYAWMVRLYGTIYSYNQRNRYMPKALIQAMGVDFDNIVGHIADLKAYMDYFHSRASTMVVPNDMTYFQRHTYLASEIFMDANSPKAQFYLFNPESYMLYDGYTDRKGGRCIYAHPEATSFLGTYTFDDIKNFGNMMLERVLTDVDCGTISGDILKAFEGNTIKLGIMPYEYNIVPKFDPWILLQIHNATIVDGVSVGPVEQTEPQSTWEGRRLFQDLKLLNNSIADNNWHSTGGKMIDAFTDVVSPEMVLEMTRFMYHMDYTEESAFDYLAIRYTGSEVITSAKILVMSNATDEVAEIPFFTVECIHYDAVEEADPIYNEDLIDVLSRVHLITKFDYAPAVFVFRGENSTFNWDLVSMIGDVTNPIYFDTAKLQDINQMAFSKMFNTIRFG